MKLHFFSRCPEDSLRRENFRLLAVNRELHDKNNRLNEKITQLEDTNVQNARAYSKAMSDLIDVQKELEAFKSRPKEVCLPSFDEIRKRGPKRKQA